MNRIKENTFNSSNSYLFVFNDKNIFSFDDEHYSDVIVFDNESKNNVVAFNDDSEKDNNRFTRNEFVFENERYGRQYLNKYLEHSSLFVLEGKNDFLFIGMFFLLIAFFLLGGFYL